MTLFPQLDLNYYLPQGDKNLLTKMDLSYTQGITVNQSFWSEADLDTRFREGDQQLWSDLFGNLPSFQKRVFNFNRIRRICNMITGYQRRNRKSTVVTARENSDSQTSTQFTKLMFWAMDQTDGYEMISKAFDGSVTTGLNLLQVWSDYRSDPVNGDPRIDPIAYNSFLIDPYFRKTDLSDCQFIWLRRYYTKQTVKSLLPFKADDIDALQTGGYRDGKFQFMPESYQYGMQDLMTYDEYWYRDYREATFLIDTQTGGTLEWKGNKENLKAFLKEYPHVETVKEMLPTVKLGIVVQGRVMYDGPNPLNIDLYPFVPVFTYFNPDMPYFPWRIQGVVRGLRDSQYLYNRRKIIELAILESQINSGFKYKENALVNPADVFLTGQGRGLALKQEAQMSDVEAIMAPQIPPSMIQLSEILGKEIQEISGVNEELLGMADDDKSGILSMLRQGAGLTTLQILFDQLDLSQRLLGRIMLAYMQANFTPGKVMRIIGEEPSKEFYNKAFGKYDAVVEEGLNTSTQRQLQFAQLLQLRETGVPVSSELLVKNSTLSNKEELVEAVMQQEQQQSQMSQMQQQMQIELLKAQIEKLQAQAIADNGLGIERASRVHENSALAQERHAEAQKDRELGTLHFVKALKELESMDITNLQALLALANQLQAQSVIKEKATSQQADEQRGIEASMAQLQTPQGSEEIMQEGAVVPA